MQLNFSALAFESPFTRDTVELCVKEVLQALSRSVAAKKNVEFVFQGIGRLQIRNSKVKMRFYKDFLNSMDGSGQLVKALKDVSVYKFTFFCNLYAVQRLTFVSSSSQRPETVDSVMSESRASVQPSSTVMLPR